MKFSNNNYLKSFILLAASLFAIQGCSEIPEIDDPVIGVWSRTQTDAEKTIREEWIFNDVYLGRYHYYENQTIKIKTDFGWQVNREIYTITYPGLERVPEIVIIKRKTDYELLETLSGETIATRE
jgi:hypothetical protein